MVKGGRELVATGERSCFYPLYVLSKNIQIYDFPTQQSLGKEIKIEAYKEYIVKSLGNKSV